MFKSQIKRYSLVIAVIGLLIFLHFSQILLPVESLISYYTKPILANFYLFSSKFRLSQNQQATKEDSELKVKQLEDQVNQLISENVKLKILQEENQFLRQQLKFLTKTNYKYVIANIISREESISATKNSQTFLIDKGKADGVEPELAVISPNVYQADSQGMIIGKITQAKDHLAEVDFITNPNCQLAVSLFNQSKTSGIVHGDLGLTVKMEYIPQTEEIKEGDIVMTSGLEQNIARGLVVGRIIKVIKESNALWQSAVIEPMINLDDLIIVAVLIP